VISLVMITTNLPNPNYELQDIVIANAESCARNTDTITEKILSVDMFANQGRSKEYYAKYVARGWKVIFGVAGSRRSLADNHLRGVSEAENDWVLTCEDDTLIRKIPSKEEFEFLVSKDLGVLTYNADIIQDSDIVLSTYHINNKNNYLVWGDDCFLVKNQDIRNMWLLNFPAVIIRKTHMLQLHTIAKTISRVAFEAAMTIAWKQLNPKKEIMMFLNSAVLQNEIINQDMLCKNAHLFYCNNDTSLKHVTLNKGCIWT